MSKGPSLDSINETIAKQEAIKQALNAKAEMCTFITYGLMIALTGNLNESTYRHAARIALTAPRFLLEEMGFKFSDAQKGGAEEDNSS